MIVAFTAKRRFLYIIHYIITWKFFQHLNENSAVVKKAGVLSILYNNRRICSAYIFLTVIFGILQFISLYGIISIIKWFFMLKENKKGISEKRIHHGRSDWIRTSGLLVPNQALYQTEPHPDSVFYYITNSKECQERIINFPENKPV